MKPTNFEWNIFKHPNISVWYLEEYFTQFFLILFRISPFSGIGLLHSYYNIFSFWFDVWFFICLQIFLCTPWCVVTIMPLTLVSILLNHMRHKIGAPQWVSNDRCKLLPYNPICDPISSVRSRLIFFFHDSLRKIDSYNCTCFTHSNGAPTKL